METPIDFEVLPVNLHLLQGFEGFLEKSSANLTPLFKLMILMVYRKAGIDKHFDDRSIEKYIVNNSLRVRNASLPRDKNNERVSLEGNIQ